MTRAHLLDRLIGDQMPEFRTDEELRAFEATPYRERIAAQSTLDGRVSTKDPPFSLFSAKSGRERKKCQHVSTACSAARLGTQLIAATAAAEGRRIRPYVAHLVGSCRGQSFRDNERTLGGAS